MLPYPLRAPTWPAERGAGLCTAPSTYRLGVQGRAGRARSRVKPEAARGAQPQASTERVRISGRSPALDRRSPAEGHYDDESRRRERRSAAPRVADSAHQRRHPRNQIHGPDFRARKSPDQAARPSRSGLALSGAPGGRQARAAGVRAAIPQEASTARSAAGAKASGIDARRGETRPARRSTARCVARKPGPIGETPKGSRADQERG